MFNAQILLFHLVLQGLFGITGPSAFNVKHRFHDADRNTFFADANHWKNENIVQAKVDIQPCQDANTKI